MGSENPHRPPGQKEGAGDYHDPVGETRLGAGESERQQSPESKGSPGATSARQTQAPDRRTGDRLEEGDTDAKRYGGGEQPHEAPGGILPTWLQGPEDPHFQDAGLGDAEGTGRKSGQPGTGHAAQLKGAETPRAEVPREMSFHLSGQRQEGHWESYESDLPGSAAKVPSRRPDEERTISYSRVAEEALSRERVPLVYRELVKRYFSAIEESR